MGQWNRSCSKIGLSCKECTDKYPGCHSHCDTYKSAVAERNTKRDEIRKVKKLEGEWLGYIKQMHER